MKTLLRTLASVVTCAVMATCSYSRDSQGGNTFSGGLNFDLPIGGYSKDSKPKSDSKKVKVPRNVL